jgi:E3 ubiquitin-protein ligase DOA10
MFEDFLRTATIILLLISGYLIIKKIIELESRVLELETIIHTKQETYEEEYSTDHLFSMIKNPQEDEIFVQPEKIIVQPEEIIVQPKEEEIFKDDIIYTPEKQVISPSYTETIMLSDTDEEKRELAKKYNKMKLAELHKISLDLNIEIKNNGKNKSKKNLIKEIISHLNNNG